MNETPATSSIGDKLLSIKRGWLFLILFAITTIPQFMNVPIPNKPSDSAADLYRELMSLPKGSTVIVQSDWTNSTRGESRGQFDALMRILMRKEVKFALMSVADTQAPEVARNVIDDINKERAEKGQRVYKRWDDWVNMGYFPSAEATGTAMAQSVRDAFKDKRDKDESGRERPVTESPVFEKVQNIGDCSALIVVTGNKSITIAIGRLQAKVKMLGMVTGVMGPETNNYYVSGQLKGLSSGLKGVFDMETMMQDGVNTTGADGKKHNSVSKYSDEVAGWPGEKNLDKGTRYILALHFAIALLIIFVVIGNLGVYLTRKKGGS